MAQSRYVKLALFEATKTNLMGSTIVGQFGDTILIERPAPKPRAKSGTTRKPRATKTATQPATSFNPPAAV
jgi:hypothetical protein